MILRALALPLACTLLALPLAPRAEAPAAPALALRTLHVTGDGRVTVTPDVAVLVAGVETTQPDLSRATKEVATRMKRILSALADAGVAEKDVQTTEHQVQVERPWQNGKPGPITGYTVSDEVRITVRDLPRLGQAIDKLTAAGANALHSLSFRKDDPGPERARALAAAYAVARAKAEALARAAGVALGEVLQLGETTQAPPMPIRPMAAMRAEAADTTPIAAGEVEITASVDVTYALR
jgi:uncharacterized protein YggE